MYRKILSLLTLLLIITVSFESCSSGKTNLSKVWFYTHYDDVEASAENKEEAAVNGSLDVLKFSPSNFLCLQPDGNYTLYFGDFEYGTWSVEDNTIRLSGSRNQLPGIRFFMTSPKELLVKVPSVDGTVKVLHFESSAIKVKTAADNPFSKENNLWRIKASEKESDAAIVQRLHNHFRYWEKYFNWGMLVERNYLDVRSLPGPLKIYGNGFELLPYDKWSPAWISRFYDDEDSRKAYNKLLYFMNHDNIAWAKTDNKFKMFISAFQQLQQKVQ